MENTGTVISSDHDKIIIQMDGAGGSGCATCGSKHACSPSQGARFVELKQHTTFKEGDRVKLEMGEARSIGLAFLLFILPLLIIIAAYVIFSSLKMSEGLSILSAIGTGALSFLVILKLEDQLMKKARVSDMEHDAPVQILPLQD